MPEPRPSSLPRLTVPPLLAQDDGPPAPGEVVLVGAGPGDPGLVTVAGLAAVRRADVVVHDRLVALELLAERRAEAELIDVSKRPGGRSTAQPTIHRILIEQAHLGRRVVRLKGGDPFVFGRGAEELAALEAAGIRATVIPGVTSAVAGPAAIGVPLTHRRLARSFTVVTGRSADDEPLPWAALTRLETLVILMGVASIESICRELIAHGKDPATPAAIVENAWSPEQRSVRARLADLPSAARDRDVQPPAIVVIGHVVGLGSETVRDALRAPNHQTRRPS